MPQLTVHNAQISTAVVEIKTLTITGKQVTLAVFRQLIEEDLVAEDGTLNGVPWGTVNYHPEKCAESVNHWHVVWQRGTELRRSRVSVIYQPPLIFWPESLERHYAACVHRWLSTGAVEYWRGSIFKLFSGELTGSSGLAITTHTGRQGWLRNYDDVTFTDEETRIKVGAGIPGEVSGAVLARSKLVGVSEALRAKKKWAAEKRQILQDARQNLVIAESGSAPSRPEDHGPSCTCDRCCRADVAIAEKMVSVRQNHLESAEEQVQRYSLESPERAEARSEFAAALALLGDRYATEPLDQLLVAYRDDLTAEAARRQRHADVRKAIGDLAQLFIAV